ncbi:DUF1887 family protein [Clostridium amazonitimonense]|uniref:DUF1887 family protein n=1 Tax=Clostridium amazonitimonense TaxID=1499689 RepID=UPI000509DC1C|nr:DUF1887 family protein [Clostridium amazonitimonense]
MSEEKIDSLVICSTLNQITNYLMIKKYEPKTVFNITFKDNAKELNWNIKPQEWDNQLKSICNGITRFEDIELTTEDIYSLSDIKEKIHDNILENVSNDKKIYWHVTGGQRTIALAISELIKDKERKNDKLLYIEGNTEILIINTNEGELDSYEEDYGYKNLTFNEALILTGFNTKKLDSTKPFKEKGKEIIKKDDKEYRFYKELYRIIHLEKESKISINYGGSNELITDTFRNLLLKSNNISKNTEERRLFIRLLFEKLLDKYSNLREIEYYNKDNVESKDEFNQSYPAGYIFEKLTAYKIYDLIKDNPKILGMETSLKTYFTEEKKKNAIIDELDIVLLTNTGKIINFECKSGGMKGDNAKSHNYTTYRLAGVFGMPILLSPLYKNEENSDCKNENKELEKPFQALRAAKAAELEVFTVDEIENGLRRLGIIEEN